MRAILAVSTFSNLSAPTTANLEKVLAYMGTPIVFKDVANGISDSFPPTQPLSSSGTVVADDTSSFRSSHSRVGSSDYYMSGANGGTPPQDREGTSRVQDEFTTNNRSRRASWTSMLRPRYPGSDAVSIRSSHSRAQSSDHYMSRGNGEAPPCNHERTLEISDEQESDSDIQPPRRTDTEADVGLQRLDRRP
jgi:hypothetical protein